jgi:hypothetical protein
MAIAIAIIAFNDVVFLSWVLSSQLPCLMACLLHESIMCCVTGLDTELEVMANFLLACFLAHVQTGLMEARMGQSD